MEEKALKGRNALIIGASGGIGMAVAELFSTNGAALFLTCNKNEALLKQESSQRSLADAKIFQLDITDEKATAKTVAKIMEQAKIDIVVYTVSAAVEYKRVQELEWQDYQQHYDVQVKGLHNLIRAMWPQIKSRYRTRFIAVLTEACIGKPPSMLSHYVSAKYGMLGFMKSMASELGAYSSTFNMVSPGMVKTPLIAKFPSKVVEMAALSNPAKRIAEPAEVAQAILFLASDSADYLNGVNIPLNGGSIMV